MGIGPSNVSRIRHNLRSREWCKPHNAHIPFPSDRYQPNCNHLVLDFPALPRLAVIPSVLSNETGEEYWWTDAEFLPGCDAVLAVTSTVYHPRGAQAWMMKHRFPAGRIFLADFSNCKSEMINMVGTESSVFPKVQPHPRGEHIAYAGRGTLRIVNTDNEAVYERGKDLDNASYRFCAIAPNGVCFATICRCQGMYEVKFFLLDVGLMNQGSVTCHKVCPSFRCHSPNEHVELKWSPDSKFLAVSCTWGQLFLLERTTLQNVCTLCPQELEELSNAGCFDFHPHYCHQLLAVGGRSGEVTLFDFEQKAELWSVEVACAQNQVDCLRFDPAGTVVGVACRDLTIRLLAAEDGSETWRLDMTPSCPPTLASRAPTGFPVTMRLVFSQEGGHLVTSSCDGCVRVWAVPRMLSLQRLCRQAVLRRYCTQAIHHLPIPNKVKDFLQSQALIKPDPYTERDP